MTAGPVPHGGVIDGGKHLLPLRVYYEDTDAGGIVYHANYLRYAERARTEMLRMAGIDMSRLRDEQGLIFVLYRGEIAYHRPARFDDRLLVVSEMIDLGGATVVIDQAIWRLDDAGARDFQTVSFTAHVALMQPSGRPARFPKDLRDRMESLIRQPVARPATGPSHATRIG